MTRRRAVETFLTCNLIPLSLHPGKCSYPILQRWFMQAMARFCETFKGFSGLTTFIRHLCNDLPEVLRCSARLFSQTIRLFATRAEDGIIYVILDQSTKEDVIASDDDELELYTWPQCLAVANDSILHEKPIGLAICQSRAWIHPQY